MKRITSTEIQALMDSPSRAGFRKMIRRANRLAAKRNIPLKVEHRAVGAGGSNGK